MDQMQTVPGPSQAAFNTLNNQIGNKANYFSMSSSATIIASLYQSGNSYTIQTDGWYQIAFATDDATITIDGVTDAGKNGNRQLVPLKQGTVLVWVSGTTHIIH